MALGRLQVRVIKGASYVPIENARITVLGSPLSGERQPPQVLQTNSSGLTNEIELNAPPIDFSMRPSNNLPYSTYDLKIEAEGYRDMIINGCQIFPDELAIQTCPMLETIPRAGLRQNEEVVINIAPNRLSGNFPPKIPEEPLKPPPSQESGLVVLNQVVVPGLIVVHAGTPNDTSAPNYTVGYTDYIKNVASCEIFSTWPESTIRANVYCIISFTLNRIYTEWYRGKGKNFDITSSTAYDHAFSYGRNIYASISRIVDQIFATYMKRSAVRQPLLAQYCDGVKVQCPNWLSQWGSKYLGDQGRTPYQILTNYYGSDLNLVTAPRVSGIPMSYPGYVLGIGSTGTPVRTVQTYLNRIAVNYPAIPKMVVDGIYGQGTRNSVLAFQKIFFLPQTGTVNYATWYKISDIYVAVTKIGELRGESYHRDALFVPPVLAPNNNSDIPTVSYEED